MKKYLFLFLLIILSSIIKAQEITGRILDKSNHLPVNEVSIKSTKNFGTSTNTKGEFTIKFNSVDTLFISHIAYKSIQISCNDLILNNFLILLEEKTNELNEIILNTSKITIETILDRTTKNMIELYASKSQFQKFYLNNLDKIDVQNIKIEFDAKNTTKDFDLNHIKNRIKNFEQQLLKNKTGFASHFKGNSKRTLIKIKDSNKPINTIYLNDLQGYKNIGKEKITDLDDILKQGQNIILEALNKNTTYKVKSGLFKISDTLSANSIKKSKPNSTFSYNDVSGKMYKPIENTIFFLLENEKNFFSSKYYHHELISSNSKFYTIKFIPKKTKSKYTGFVIIDKKLFTINNVNYQLEEGKKGDSLNLKFLLGIKFSENSHQVNFSFQTETNFCYLLNYKEIKNSNYYVNRPIKFIENSKQKLKLNIQFKIETTKNEITEINLSKPIEDFIRNPKPPDFKKNYNYLTEKELEKVKW